MQLTPGPLPQLDVSWYPTTYDVPNFEQMVNDWWMGADQIIVSLDSWIPPDLPIDDGLTGDTIYADLESADHVNGDNAASVNLSGIPVGDKYKADGDAALVAANEAIPGEAWQPVPASTQYGTVAQAAPTAAIAGVALANLSGGDPQAYQVNEQFQLVVRMDMTTGLTSDWFNVHIWAVMTVNGVAQPNLDLGHTDSTGSVTYRGQWQTSDIGQWTMYVHAVPTTGGELVSIQYSWTVSDTIRRQPNTLVPVVNVQLVNISSGTLSNNRAGDLYQLTVTGPPDQPVYITGTRDGFPFTEVQIGTTDATGTLSVRAAWGAGDTGAWVEQYAVGRYPWAGSLVFTVQPAAG